MLYVYTLIYNTCFLQALTGDEQINLTMALLLATQTWQEHPFVVIDENDMISQSSARQAVIDAVCRHARSYEKQLLYMTQFSLNNTPAAADLKVIAMQSVQR